MTPLLTLIAIITAPIALLILLRVNAAIVFLSLCLGDVLVQFVANDANSLTQAVLPNTADNTLRLGLLLLPAILTTIFMIRTVKKSHLLINILPAVGVGLLTALLAVPLLSSGLATNIVSLSIWHQIERSQDLVVGLSAVICLGFLWLQRPKTGKSHGKHH